MWIMEKLCALLPGQRATVLGLENQEPLRRRLMELGLVPGTEVMCLGRSPGGDPAAYRVRGAVIALRAADCARIIVEKEEIHKWD